MMVALVAVTLEVGRTLNRLLSGASEIFFLSGLPQAWSLSLCLVGGLEDNRQGRVEKCTCWVSFEKVAAQALGGDVRMGGFLGLRPESLGRVYRKRPSYHHLLLSIYVSPNISRDVLRCLLSDL